MEGARALAKHGLTAADIVALLEQLGAASYKKVLLNHGVCEPVFGVKIEELKKLQKRIKQDHELALELFATGNYDVQYLAGLIADAASMTRRDLQHWLKTSNCTTLCGTMVAAVAAESRHGFELSLKWIDSSDERTASTGWTTLAGLVAIRDDSELELATLKQLLERVVQTIHQQPDRVRYAMNGYVIALGSYVASLTGQAVAAGEAIGPLAVDMGNTACKVPFAPDYIRKVEVRGSLGKKRKAVRC